MENSAASDSADATVTRGAQQGDGAEWKGKFHWTCHDKDGNLKWEDDVENVITTVGKNEILDKALAGSAYTAALFLGLISSVGYGAGVVVGDTMASHAGWTEAGPTNAPNYSQGTRPAISWSAAAGGVKATSAAVVFSPSGSGTVKGSFVTTVSTKDGITGILISGGVFTGGDKVVSSGDTLNGTYQITLT